MAARKPKIPEDAIIVDIDESRRARTEAQSGFKPVYVKFKDQYYEIQREIPLALVVELGELDNKDETSVAKFAVEMSKSFLGDRGWKKFVDSGAGMSDLFDLFNKAFAALASGVTPGEAAASAGPSRSTGTQPRQPSKPDTASTS